MYGYIYMTTNKINNKIYIGKKTSNKFRNYYYGSGKLIRDELSLFGKENFVVEQLATAESRDELNYLEKLYIQLYRSYDPSIGYNMTLGGDGGNTVLFLSESELIELNKKKSANSSGRIHIHNGAVQKYVKLDDLDEYINSGYVVGILPDNIDKIRTGTAEYHKNNPHRTTKTSFKKGNRPWNVGIPMKDSSKKKLSELNTGHIRTEESKIKQSETMKRQYASGERVSALKGVQAHNKGQRGIFHWYTDGTTNIMLKYTDPIPENFYPGRTKISNK